MANEHLTVRAIRAESYIVMTDVVDGTIKRSTVYALHLYNGNTVTGTADGGDDAARAAARAAAEAKVLPVALAVQAS